MKIERLGVTVWVMSALVFVMAVLATSAALPETVATHFGPGGEPDGWMSRSAHRIAFLGLGFGTSGLVIGLCFAIRFFPPSLLNVPRADYWRSPEHYPAACAYVFRHAFWLGSLMLVFLAFLHGDIVEANLARPVRLSGGGAVKTVALFLAGVAVWVLVLWQHFSSVPRRRPETRT
jgi:uncharacterized membrane protein